MGKTRDMGGDNWGGDRRWKGERDHAEYNLKTERVNVSYRCYRRGDLSKTIVA